MLFSLAKAACLFPSYILHALSTGLHNNSLVYFCGLLHKLWPFLTTVNYLLFTNTNTEILHSYVWSVIQYGLWCNYQCMHLAHSTYFGISVENRLVGHMHMYIHAKAENGHKPKHTHTHTLSLSLNRDVPRQQTGWLLCVWKHMKIKSSGLMFAWKLLI